MHFECTRCGGPLEVQDDDYLVECSHCGVAVAIDRDRASGREPSRPPELPRKPPLTDPSRWLAPLLVLTALLTVFVVGSVVFFEARPPEVPRPAEANLPVEAMPPPRPPPTYDEPPGPVVSRPEAKKLLSPKVLACMKEHRVHYLITRIGQGYDAPRGLYPPLTLVYGSVVDYRDVDDLVDRPLGRCIVKAANELWFQGPRGAYINFGLRNPEAPDPLAGQPERIDQKAARRALRALDEAAHECGRRKLEGFKPGRDLSMLVFFRGLEGKVVGVDPYYIPSDSPYGKCIQEAYAPATVRPFRDLRAKVLHKLPFDRPGG